LLIKISKMSSSELTIADLERKIEEIEKQRDGFQIGSSEWKLLNDVLKTKSVHLQSKMDYLKLQEEKRESLQPLGKYYFLPQSIF
jgi:hypothetical protein